jgi:hypothetical protein
MLGFLRKLSGEFRNLYIFRTLYVSLVRPKLEYASCVWRPFYDVHICRIQRVQRELPPYVDRCALHCALICLETLTIEDVLMRA